MRGRFLHAARVKILLLAFAVVLAATGGCKEEQPATTALQSPAGTGVKAAEPLPPFLTNAQPRLQTMRLFVGSQELRTELALKPVEIYTGMMWRTNMAENEGMLFVFADASPRSFYMRNTLVPLSLAYIDPEGIIQEIHDLHPRNETPVPSKADNIQFVLEVPQGWFKRRNISPGTLVRTEFGELKNTFSFRALPRK